jgi:glycosyltransferase involved in cell wall biosynthesis
MTAASAGGPIKVSVLIVTYNQAAFIEQAVRSALTQDTTFATEVIVADDASTDGTRLILERLAGQHPDTLRLVTHDTHVGVHQNCVDGYVLGSGEYLAMLNGDDYWISPYKLQRQVNFLDRHAECAICFHNVLTVHDQGDAEALACSSGQKAFSGVEDLLVENFMATSSVMYRHGLVREFPEWVRPLMTWDWALHLYHTQYGRIGYLADTMAVTRRHAGGLWNGASTRERSDATVAMLEQVNRHFQGKYDATIRASIARWRQVCTFEQLRESVKRLEGEWMRRIEQMQLERAREVNELRAQYHEAVQDLAQLPREGPPHGRPRACRAGADCPPPACRGAGTGARRAPRRDRDHRQPRRHGHRGDAARPVDGR